MSVTRLVDTNTLQLVTVGHNCPPYAILSHTWAARKDEVTLRDMTATQSYHLKPGWAKITNAACLARADGWNYIWIDTCCIDRRNHTERALAITSMYNWYRDAQICYVHLADVAYSSWSTTRRSFRASRWFTRGWTLQELLAPTFLYFVDYAWNKFGTRQGMAAEICDATGILPGQLNTFAACSVATKLSWAAHRETRRLEDRAYSLLGLLGLTMTVKYGEGHQALVRLQAAIMSQGDDDTFMAWGTARKCGPHHVFLPLSGDNCQCGPLTTYRLQKIRS